MSDSPTPVSELAEVPTGPVIAEVRPADAPAGSTAWRGRSGTVYPATIHAVAGFGDFGPENTVGLLVTRQDGAAAVVSIGPTMWPRLFLDALVMGLALHPAETLEIHTLDGAMTEAERLAVVADLSPEALQG